ncbi:MAG: hypothetical protein KGJ62_13610 [Armatimonadetes bacterium]|nr:hypothetical protein [Armatimonadota bacterium]MDE2206214.1 hypothetical protein [Armatimonadota bacterium]
MAAKALPHLLSIDVGTSSVRACRWTQKLGRVRGGWHQVPVRLEVGADGRAELEPEGLWTALGQCLDAVAGSGAPIGAVSLVTYWHGLLGVGADLAPVTRITTWADSRAAGALGSANSEQAQEWLQETGCRPHFSYPACRLAWLRKSDPGAWRKANWWLAPADFLLLRLLGLQLPQTSLSIASATGLLSRKSLNWSSLVLDDLQLKPDRLPALHDLDAHLPALSSALAKRWPALGGAEWLPALGDGAAGNVGSGCTSSATAAINIGTSSAVRRIDTQTGSEIPSGCWEYRLDAQHRVLGQAFSDGGVTLRWLMNRLRLPADRKLNASIAAVYPQSEVVWLPFLAGERSPGWSPARCASASGIRLATLATDIACSAMEGIAILLADGVDAVEGLGKGEVVISGGAVRAMPVWAHMVADIIQRPVKRLRESEATSRGGAVLAALRLGAFAGLESAPVPAADEVLPNRGNAVACAELRKRFHEQYEMTSAG